MGKLKNNFQGEISMQISLNQSIFYFALSAFYLFSLSFLCGLTLSLVSQRRPYMAFFLAFKSLVVMLTALFIFSLTPHGSTINLGEVKCSSSQKQLKPDTLKFLKAYKARKFRSVLLLGEEDETHKKSNQEVK